MNILNYAMNLTKSQILLLIINIITIMNLKKLNYNLKDKKTKFIKRLCYYLSLKGQLKKIENTEYVFQLETNRQEHYLIKEIGNRRQNY
jgi:hypothetical protein